MQQKWQFRYPECRKGLCHEGQVLNLICLHPQCQHQNVICGICYDQEHRNHKIRPIKLLISNAKKYLQELTPLGLDQQKVKGWVEAGRTKLITSFNDFEKYVKASLESIRNSMEAIFTKISDQIHLKVGKNDSILSAIQALKHQQTEYEAFVSLIQTLLTGVPIDLEDEQAELSAQELEESLKSIQKNIQKDLEGKQTAIRAQIDTLLKKLQAIVSRPYILEGKIDFKFSSELKHSGISVVSDSLVKSSGGGYTYHFGLLEPSLEDGANRECKVAFKIKEDANNWVALGACYKNSIAANNYTFNQSGLDHGAYLISSNGGSWSSIDATKNNTLTSFSYAKSDIITIEYLPSELKLVFRKKGSQLQYVLEFQAREEDELHLCVQFYYNDDQIEFIGYDDQ